MPLRPIVPVRGSRIATLCTLAAFAACSAPQQTALAPLRPLPESRALEVILDAFRQVGVEPELHRRIHIQHNRELEIDVATRGHNHGVEYIMEQDRTDFGDALPRRRTADSLLTVVGIGPDANVDVLLLQDTDFRYEPIPEQNNESRPTLIEVEDRLRRNVVDYLTYLRQHNEL